MTKALDGKSYEVKPYVAFPRCCCGAGQFDERDVASVVTPKRGYHFTTRFRQRFQAAAVLCMASLLNAAGASQDLVLTIDTPTIKKDYGYPEFYNQILIRDDFTLDNSYLTNGYTGASITIGNDTKPIVVTITNAVKQSLPTRSSAELNITGKGARIDVAAITPPSVDWGSQFKTPPLSDVFGMNSYESNGGTFGRQLKVCFNIDTDAVPSEQVVDVLHLYTNGYFGLGEFHNQTAGSVSRILFDGGRMYGGNSTGTWFQPDSGTEIRLESVNGNPIYLWHFYSQGYFTTANGTSAAGVVSTRGSSDVVLGGPKNSSSAPGFKLKGRVNWGHSGDTYLTGVCHYKLMNDNFLPFGSGTGDVYVMRYCSKYGSGASWSTTACCWLDLNGTTQKVNSILAYEDGMVKGKTFVTNTASRRATLEVGEFVANATLKGVFSGNFDIRLKGSANPDLTDPSLNANPFSIVGGANLYLANADWTISGERTFDSRAVHQPDGYKTTFSNACMGDFAAIGRQTVISNALHNVYIKGVSPDGDPHPPASIVRDLPPTFLWNISLNEDDSLNVINGALVTSNLTASSGARFVVSSNAAIRLQSTAVNPGAGRYYRFTFKENFGKKQFAFGTIKFVREDRTTYAPGATGGGYSLNETAQSATDLQEGEFMYSGVPFVGGGLDLPATFPWSYRQASYNYVRAGIFGSNDGMALTTFNDGKTTMDRNDSSTWRVFTIRLKGDAPALVGYRLSNLWNIDSHVNCWLVETSADGMNWTAIDERSDYGCFSYHKGQGNPENPLTEGYGCFNANTSVYGGADHESGEGSIFRWTKSVGPETVHADFGGATVRVDCGGLLDLVQTDGAVALDKVEVDVSRGMGTFRHVTFSATGSFNLVNDGATLRTHTYLPVIFEDCGGLANLNNWRVTLNGEDLRNGILSYDAQKGRIDVHICRGIVITFR